MTHITKPDLRLPERCRETLDGNWEGPEVKSRSAPAWVVLPPGVPIFATQPDDSMALLLVWREARAALG
ncbi:MAG TPA: hypothetical protein VLA61_17125 [Ideonella sp.]|uniref:hypothetical protein n=1 Tax=Ideonella sp. TaxID=1929293 RepID=UPI002CD31F46|nr:hypothetical protein [Ideonella sp.]HSI49996.1 hypothetical protein [Ideonella sp.]